MNLETTHIITPSNSFYALVPSLDLREIVIDLSSQPVPSDLSSTALFMVGRKVLFQRQTNTDRISLDFEQCMMSRFFPGSVITTKPIELYVLTNCPGIKVTMHPAVTDGPTPAHWSIPIRCDHMTNWDFNNVLNISDGNCGLLIN